MGKFSDILLFAGISGGWAAFFIWIMGWTVTHDPNSYCGIKGFPDCIPTYTTMSPDSIPTAIFATAVYLIILARIYVDV